MSEFNVSLALLSAVGFAGVLAVIWVLMNWLVSWRD